MTTWPHFRIYSLVSAVGLFLGESWFVLTTHKFPPLWLDDYFASMVMLIAVYYSNRQFGPALLLASWTLVLGNMYAMLFTRLEPINPPERPWMLLAVLTVWAFLSSVTALTNVVKDEKNQQLS